MFSAADAITDDGTRENIIRTDINMANNLFTFKITHFLSANSATFHETVCIFIIT